MKHTASRNRGVIILLLAMVFLLTHSCSSERSPSEGNPSVGAADTGLDLLIKKSITEWATPAKAVIRKEMIYSAVLVENFYKVRGYWPAWSEEGHLVQVEPLLRAVEETYGDGLRPSYYHLGLIRSLVAQAGKGVSLNPTLLADLDILLTDAFLTLSCHLSGGCVNPLTIKAEWYAKRANVDVAAVLEQALKNKEIKEAMISFRPEEGSYVRLRQMLAHYRQLFEKGEWPQLSDGSPLKLNSTSSRVADLKKRLAASNDLDPAGVTGDDFFDEKLHQSVIGFQKRHGLKADGVVGSATLNALNVPLEQRIRQIEVNMERLRWTLGNKEQRSIVVNIANFEMYSH